MAKAEKAALNREMRRIAMAKRREELRSTLFSVEDPAWVAGAVARRTPGEWLSAAQAAMEVEADRYAARLDRQMASAAEVSWTDSTLRWIPTMPPSRLDEEFNWTFGKVLPSKREAEMRWDPVKTYSFLDMPAAAPPPAPNGTVLLNALLAKPIRSNAIIGR